MTTKLISCQTSVRKHYLIKRQFGRRSAKEGLNLPHSIREYITSFSLCSQYSRKDLHTISRRMNKSKHNHHKVKQKPYYIHQIKKSAKTTLNEFKDELILIEMQYLEGQFQ